MWDWAPYVVDGGARPDAISGLQDPFEKSMAALFAAAPPEIRDQLRVASGYRSNERQAELWANALAKYGDEATARQWVAPPGRSQHNHGSAIDLRYLSPAAQEWIHANAGQFGLGFPLSNEPWHIEPLGARDGTAYTGAYPGQTAEPTDGQAGIVPGNFLAQYSQPPAWKNSLRAEQFMSAPRQNALRPFGVS